MGSRAHLSLSSELATFKQLRGDSLQQLLTKQGAGTWDNTWHILLLKELLQHWHSGHTRHMLSGGCRENACAGTKMMRAVPREIAAPELLLLEKAHWDEKGSRSHTVPIFWAHLACASFGNHGHIPPCLVWEGKNWTTQAHLKQLEQ